MSIRSRVRAVAAVLALAASSFATATPTAEPPARTPVVRVPSPERVSLARRVRFDPITMASGLSHSYVWTVVQDRRGFIWMGTRDGLNRFDGHRMTVFRYDPFDPNSLGGSPVRRILEDSAGMVWLAHGSNGVTRFNPDDETFLRYRHDPGDADSLAGDVVFNVFEDTLGRIWFSGPQGAGGLTSLDPRTGHFTRLEMKREPKPDAYQGGVIWRAIAGGEGQMWLAADFLVEELDPETQTFTHYFPPRPDRRVNSIARAPDGTVWAGGQNGIYRVDRASRTLVPSELPLRGIQTMTVDARERFWIGNDDGVYVVERGMRRILQHFGHDARDPATLPSSQIRDLLWSRSGLLWVATTAGVGTFHQEQDRFVNFSMPWSDSTATPPEASVTATADGTLWMTHGVGLARIDVESGTASVFDFSSVFEDGRIAQRIYADSHDGVWFSRGESVHRLDIAGRRVQSFQPPRGALPRGAGLLGPPAFVTGFTEDSEGDVWIAANRGGLFVWDRETGSIEAVRPPAASLEPGYPSLFHVATSLALSRSGTLWVGTEGGELIAVDPRTRGVVRRFTPKDTPELPESEIGVVHEDARGTLWLGTFAGLVRVDSEKPAFRLYGYTAGLDSPAVESIQEDDAGRLWLATRAGLVEFDPASERFRRFDTDDGLPTNIILSGARLGDTGWMSFAERGGFTLFRPDAVSGTTYEPPVLLTGFELMYEAQHPGKGGVLEKPVWATEEIELEHDQNVFGFEFAALDYVSPDKNRYRYRLEGFDETWNAVDSDHRLATYTHVPPGEYTFRVERWDRDGEWQRGGASTRLTVKPAWWMTPWARGGAVAILLATVLGWHRARLSQIRRQNVQLEERVANRTAELEEANRRLALAATTDPLTGVPNRRHYIERAEQELIRLKRHGRVMTIALADVDDFKRVNDVFGHELGDRVLRDVAETLRSQIREQDIVARWGGEEFILLFPDTDAAGASIVAEKLRARIEAAAFDGEGERFGVTMTIGVAEASKDAALETCIARADAALYEGKRTGKNRVLVSGHEGRAFSPSMTVLRDDDEPHGVRAALVDDEVPVGSRSHVPDDADA